MNQIVEQRREPLMPVSETAAIIHMIERAARDPAVDIDKLERLLQMQERVVAARAKAEFDTAMAEMQPRLPVVDRRGKITIRDKNDREKVIQSTPYALWEDINEAMRPMLAEHGFALSFRTGVASDGKITVTCILSHRSGHREETTLNLAHDSTGSKNAVQAVGSSMSYGKRYTACAMLNITTKGEDDDGKSADTEALIDEQQREWLQTCIVETGTDIARFCRYLDVERLEHLPKSQYPRAIDALNAKRKAAVQ